MATNALMAEWKAGRVPHVLPVKAAAVQTWPRVPAGPDRLESLYGMWLDHMKPEKRDALRSFLFPGQI